MLLSIIIAAYNSEKTIAKTIESIKHQMRDGMEILIVNDGSIDSTKEIIERYKTDKIMVFTIPNSGVSAARNYGLLNAKGKYVWFVDSDDFIEEGSVDCIFELFKSINPDVLMANYSILRGTHKSIIQVYEDEIKFFNSHEEIGECCRYLLNKSSFDSAIWKNIYKKSFLLENNILFDKHLFMNEDGNWLFEVLIKSNSIVTVAKSIYIYNMGSPTSVTKKKQTLASYKCSNYVYSRWYDKFAHAFTNDEINSMLTRRMADGYANSSVSIMSMNKSDKERAFELFMNRIQVLNDASNRYGKLIKLGRITGYRFSLKLANFVYRVMRFLK